MRRFWQPEEWAGLAVSGAVLAVLVGLDILLTGDEAVITTSFVIAPFAAALLGAAWVTGLMGVAAVALAVAAGAWNGDFGAGDYLLRLAIVAAGSGFAVVAARARADAHLTMRRFQILDEVASIADGSLALPATLERLTEVVVPELADICMIDTIAHGTVDRVAVRAAGPDRAEVEAGLAARRPSVPEHMLEEDEADNPLEPRFLPEHSEDVLRQLAHDEADFGFLKALGSKSSITVPLTARGHRLGAMTLITASSGRRYRREDVRFARVLSGRVALVLDNAGLFSDLRSVERRMDTVMEVLDEAVVIHDRAGTLVFANDAAARILDYGSPAELIGLPVASIRRRHDLYDEEGGPLGAEDLLPSVAGEGRQAAPRIFRAISRRDGREVWLRARSSSIMGPSDTALWTVTALEDVSEIKEAEFAQTMLARTGELLASSIDYRGTLRQIARLAIPQLADWCSIHVPDSEGLLEQVALAHHDEERMERVQALSGERPLSIADPAGPGQVLRTGETFVTTDVGALIDNLPDPEQARRARELGIGSLMIFPMEFAGRVIGTLTYANDADRRPFDDFDRALGKRIADRAAVATENSRLATERTEIAKALQRGLLPPPLPDIPGWAIAALFRPAGAENEVGGDFYEVFEHAGGWMLVIGDVTGRGAEAAAVTAAARYTLRTAGVLTGDPMVALAQLNRTLLAKQEPSLCTVAVLSLELDAGEIGVVVAGHPPPLLVGPGGVREIGRTGPVLGAFEDATWPRESVELGPGEHIVVYTDGVTEASGPGGRFGEERLRAGLAGTGGPNQAIGKLERALEEFAGADLSDDAAVLAIARAMAPPERAGAERAAAAPG